MVGGYVNVTVRVTYQLGARKYPIHTGTSNGGVCRLWYTGGEGIESPSVI